MASELTQFVGRVADELTEAIEKRLYEILPERAAIGDLSWGEARLALVTVPGTGDFTVEIVLKPYEPS